VIHRVARPKAGPYAAPPLPPEPLELEACYRYCEALTRARHHNFPVASRFAPSRLRRHIFALYAFARTADDFADEPAFAGRRARELDRWEERLEACFHGDPPDHPVFVCLADTVSRFDLPITPLSSLLAGFRIDLDVRRHATAVDLLNYTALAAAPLGHLLLYMSGYRDPALHRYADDLAAGLAFASFWQDIADDLDRDRIYVPQEDLRHFGLDDADLFARHASPAVTALVRYEAARTRALFERARPLVKEVGHDLAVELALMWHGGMRILAKITRVGGRILHDRPHLTAIDKAEVVTRALAWRGDSLGPRLADRLVRSRA
jgi:squalene synthase HpnC